MNLIKRLFKFGGDSDFGTVTNVIISIIGAVIIIMGWHCISAYNVVRLISGTSTPPIIFIAK